MHIGAGRFEEVCSAMRTAVVATHAESGCNLYAMHRVTGDPSRMLVIEHWARREDLERHRRAPHMRALRETLAPLLSAPTDVLELDAIPAGHADRGTVRNG